VGDAENNFRRTGGKHGHGLRERSPRIIASEAEVIKETNYLGRLENVGQRKLQIIRKLREILA
jgi:hypothetical protein